MAEPAVTGSAEHRCSPCSFPVLSSCTFDGPIGAVVYLYVMHSHVRERRQAGPAPFLAESESMTFAMIKRLSSDLHEVSLLIHSMLVASG